MTGLKLAPNLTLPTDADRAAGEYLAMVVAQYFETLYPGRSIVEVYANTTGHTAALARSLYRYRRMTAQ